MKDQVDKHGVWGVVDRKAHGVGRTVLTWYGLSLFCDTPRRWWCLDMLPPGVPSAFPGLALLCSSRATTRLTFCRVDGLIARGFELVT